MPNSINDWVWISCIKNLSNKKKLLLIEYLNSIKELRSAGQNQLKKFSFLNNKDINSIRDLQKSDIANKYEEYILKNGIDVIDIKSSLYPKLLKNIYNPPIVLFQKGKINNEKCIAIVGSRKNTNYGEVVTKNIVSSLVKNDYTIVSGMAKGIDAIAHRKCLESNGKTLAVLGCGLDIIYPNENKDLYRDLMENGTLLTEYIFGTRPYASNFPMRNRIISGLSKGVVVIEAGEKSGAVITAELALEEGREVFAVPGNITSSNSLGTNRLIREGAKIVTEIKDILEEFNNDLTIDKIKYINNTNLVNNKFKINKFTANERMVIECLSFEELHVDMIISKTGLSVGEVNTILMSLEINGIVKSFPGKFYLLSDID
jgi:DNA processing protein